VGCHNGCQGTVEVGKASDRVYERRATATVEQQPDAKGLCAGLEEKEVDASSAGGRNGDSWR